jgi:hypothetical protein
MSDILKLQEYLFNGLLSCDLFAQFNVVLERQFLADRTVEFDAIWITPRKQADGSDGPTGIGLYVEMPRLEVPKPNSLQRNLVASIVVIEERNINMTAGAGSLKSAEELAELTLDFMFGWMLGLSSGLTPEAGAVKPAPDVIQGDGLVVYRAAVSLRREHRAVSRCDAPALADLGGGNYSLTNGANTPDAEIYYTVGAPADLSLPGKANDQAQLYAGPVAVAAGQAINWAAWRADLLPSHIQARIIS